MPRILHIAEKRGRDVLKLLLKAAVQNDFLPVARRQISRDYWPKIGKCVFQVSMDVSQFKPSELSVKVVDNTVIIEGKFAEHHMQDGFTTTQFIHSYPLPYGYNAGNVMSTLSADGTLTVCVPKPPELVNNANQRIVPIKQISPPVLTFSEQTFENSNESKKEK